MNDDKRRPTTNDDSEPASRHTRHRQRAHLTLERRLGLALVAGKRDDVAGVGAARRVSAFVRRHLSVGAHVGGGTSASFLSSFSTNKTTASDFTPCARRCHAQVGQTDAANRHLDRKCRAVVHLHTRTRRQIKTNQRRFSSLFASVRRDEPRGRALRWRRQTAKRPAARTRMSERDGRLQRDAPLSCWRQR